MQAKITRTNLLKGLKAVAKAVSTRGPLPILSHIKVEASAGALRFTATDLELGVTITLPADVAESGAIALPSRLLSDLAAKLPNESVDLQTKGKDGELVLKCGRSKFTMRGLPAGEFPELPTPTGGPTLDLDAADLLRGVRQTAYAVSDGDSAIICGVFLATREGHLEIAATDGFRLAWWQEDRTSSADIEVVIPARSLGEVVRLLGVAGAKAAKLSLHANQACFEMGDVYLTARVLDGKYPNYRQIVPIDFERTARVDREILIAATERVSIMSRETEKVAIALDFTAGQLEITGQSADRGDSSESVSIVFEGEPLKIHFQSAFLVEALKTFESDEVELRLNGALMPAILKPVDDAALTCLVMPVNVA